MTHDTETIETESDLALGVAALIDADPRFRRVRAVTGQPPLRRLPRLPNIVLAHCAHRLRVHRSHSLSESCPDRRTRTERDLLIRNDTEQGFKA